MSQINVLGKNVKNIVIIGGGPAGMMAAGTVAQYMPTGSTITLLEKNEKLGKKLYITGKGRCNLTNNTDVTGLLEHTVNNPKFMQSSYNALSATALMAFFENAGLPLKTEQGKRVFPKSDNAGHVTDALAKYMEEHGVKIKLNCTVHGVEKENKFVITTNKGKMDADAIIIATGGLSYPSTGSTGDGYGFACSLGHTITPTSPSLVPFVTEEQWVHDLEGLSLRNIKCIIKGNKKKPIYEETGEMLFTNTGVTGPIILRASAFLSDKLPAKLIIDLKPGLSIEQLDARILRDFSEGQNKKFSNALDSLLPMRLINTIVKLSTISPEKKVNNITREERRLLVALLKNLPLTLIKTTGYKEAVITKGGINVKEINPSTMMSKKIDGLFFAGEVIDVDALTGGYNLQIAFSTGYVAGKSVGLYFTED